MSNVKTTIIVEDRLTEMFDMLPVVPSLSGNSNHKPVFGYGDGKELNAFLKHRKDSPYPLIWLLYPYVEVHNKRSVYLDKVSFILAAKTNSAMQNPQRIEDMYKPLLIPLFDNIVKLFRRANITNMDNNYTIVKHPNYSSSPGKTEHAGNIIWDALKVTLSITITDDCLKTIKF